MHIVENGSGVPNANSYLSVADADAYFDLYGSPAAWVDPSAAAVLNLISQPSDGETFTVGITVYTYKVSATVDKEIPIGVDIATTVANTVDAVNAAVQKNADIPPTTTPHPDVTAAFGTNTVTFTAIVGGADGNLIVVSETFPTISGNCFDTDTLVDGIDAKALNLRLATQYLDGKYVLRYLGHRFSDEQGLQWPRGGVNLNDGRHLATTELPKELLDATAELALIEFETGDLFDGDSTNNGLIGSEFKKLDVLATRTTYIGGKEDVKVYRKVQNMLSNILKPVGELRRA